MIYLLSNLLIKTLMLENNNNKITTLNIMLSYKIITNSNKYNKNKNNAIFVSNQSQKLQ